MQVGETATYMTVTVKNYLIAAYTGLLLWGFGFPFKHLAKRTEGTDETTGMTRGQYEAIAKKYTSKREVNEINNPLKFVLGILYIFFRFIFFDFWRLHYWAIKSLI